MPAEFIDVSPTYNSTQVVRISEPAVRLLVAGQAPIDASGKLVSLGDIEGQARAVFENVAGRLRAGGASFDHVVRLCIYLVDIRAHQDAVRRVRAEYVNQAAPPASTIVEVSRLALDGMLIEVEAEAIV
jgi:enamine deaminase RidA (YjgF/YER057c/UK114 family)